ncbi:ParE family toxin-like protein [Vibrio sp. SCSIO 43137]
MLNTQNPRKLRESGFLSIKVNYNYRLLNRGSCWELLTHERYNRYV